MAVSGSLSSLSITFQVFDPSSVYFLLSTPRCSPIPQQRTSERNRLIWGGGQIFRNIINFEQLSINTALKQHSWQWSLDIEDPLCELFYSIYLVSIVQRIPQKSQRDQINSHWIQKLWVRNIVFPNIAFAANSDDLESLSHRQSEHYYGVILFRISKELNSKLGESVQLTLDRKLTSVRN